MIIPQDEYPTQIEHLVRAMDEAASALERAGMTVDEGRRPGFPLGPQDRGGA